MQAGTYLGKNPSGQCYWARLKGFSGQTSDIIANDIGPGQVIATILASDAGFQSQGCGPWYPLDQVPPRANPDQSFADGVFVVKAQVSPGTWKSNGGQGCYWERLKGFSGAFSEIIANANPQGDAIVTISPGDVGFSSERCGTWTKVS